MTKTEMINKETRIKHRIEAIMMSAPQASEKLLGKHPIKCKDFLTFSFSSLPNNKSHPIENNIARNTQICVTNN